MSTWNPNRHPDMYPARWHSLVRAGAGEYYVDIAENTEEGHEKLERVRRRMKSFWASLRGRPWHPTSQAFRHLTPRLTIASRTTGDAVLILKLTTNSEVLRQND